MENDGQTDAQVDSSTTNEQIDANSTESQVSASSADDTTQTTSTQQQVAKEGAEATNNLPPKDNLYGEFRRKIFEEIAPIIQSSVRESMLGMQGQQQNTQQVQEIKYQGKYGKRELEAILMHPDATEQDKMFANRGLGYIETKEDITREIDGRNEKQVSQSRQNQALQGIIADYPNLFNKSSNQWNFAEPLWQKAMQIYNSEPRLQGYQNEGLRIAIDRAYAQMARDGQVQIKKTQVKLNTQQRQIDKNQSQALQSGTLSPAKQNGSDKQAHAKLMEAYKNNPGDSQLRTAALSKFIPKGWLEQ